MAHTAKRWQILLLLLSGALMTAMTLIFPQIGLLEWLTMIPLAVGAYLLCADPGCTLKRAYGYGFLTVYAFYFVIYHWIINLYPLDFVGMDNASSAVVIAAGWFGLPLLQAVVGGLIFLFFRLMHKTAIFERFPLLRPFVFASLWVVFEWSSTLHWSGVPWGRLCIGQSDLLPILQSASLLGSYFVSWLLVAVNSLLAYAILYHIRAALCGGLAAILFCSNLLFGTIKMALPREEGESVRVAVIQGNIDSHEKWDANSTERTKQIYGDLTRKAAADGAELVIWPESVLVSAINKSPNTQSFLSSLARECDITMIIGAIYYEAGESNYNALFLVEPDGTLHLEDFYAKRHLVPFGEYVPMRNLIMTLIPPLANLSALGEDVMPGTDTALFETEWGRIGSLICFDSIYEQLTIDSVRDGANLMLVSSNDNWFFDSAGVYQHQVQAQLRAIESGRYLARAGSTGISSVIDPNGSILAWIDPLTEGYAVADVHIMEGNTLYTVIGNLFVYLCIAFFAAVWIIGAVRKVSQKQRKTPF